MEMEIKKIASTQSKGFQDGAVYGKYLFWFNDVGRCDVYDMESETVQWIAEFSFGETDKLVPHCNAVCFGSAFFDEKDEFPLLYANVYNNYANADPDLCGVCCVYRLQRRGRSFSLTLVQLIEIGFTGDRRYWRSENEAVVDKRPYGNFTVDIAANRLYAFVMRDGNESTRYFAFDLPKVTDGETDERLGVKKVVLTTEDIKAQFDTPYHRFVQGACCHDGKIYSVEGFCNDAVIRPALRVIDLAGQKQTRYLDFFSAGVTTEAELVDFYNGACYYGDGEGRLFRLENY